MRSTSSTKQKSRSKSGSRPRAEQATRVNRAQLRAMEARAAASALERAETGFATEVAEPVLVRRRTASAAGRAPVARARVMSRDEEYAYIREDMRRLIIIAGTLFVLMVVLLFIIE